MVRIKDGNYIVIFYDKMIEVKADSKRDAYNKAKRYFESREHRELFDNELKVCKIPSMICVLDEWMKRWFTRLESEEIIWVKQYLMRMIL